MTMEFVIGTLLALLGIGITVYHFRKPQIKVVCSPNSTANPSVIECVVTNTGRAAAKDLLLGFTGMLLIETKAFGSSDLSISIIESANPPDPNTSSIEQIKLSKSFAVHILQVPPKSEIKFTIQSIDPDNQRAAKQLMRIREEIKKLLYDFAERLREKHSKIGRKYDVEKVIAALTKRENFFSPGNFTYSEGRPPIVFLTKEEMHAETLNQEIYSKYKKEFIDLFQNRPKFLAPVVRIKIEGGESTYAIMPAYINTAVLFKVSKHELGKGGHINLPIRIPESYDIDVPPPP